MEERFSQDVSSKIPEKSDRSNSSSAMLGRITNRLKKTLSQVTVEPVMFIDGACHWSMQVFMEVVLMNKICSKQEGLSEEVCSNLTAHPEENILVQKQFSIFVFQNSIIMSILPLIFVLFMGSWSDKYGRKIPLIMSTLCHVMWSGGYLLNSWQVTWPIEMIYIVTFLDSIGGGPQGLVSTSVAYISDVTPVKTRTSRVSTAMSLWYFGGPLGNLVGALAIQYGGINLALAIVFLAHLSNLSYILFFIKESHGPFAVIKPVQENSKSENTMKKEDITKTQMVLDFFNWRRVAEAFKTAFRSRDGYARSVLIAVIISNMIRRAARGFYMYSFVSRSLGWEATIYTYWTSYRTLIAAAGSLILVPVLTRLISINDSLLIVVGSLSLIGEYCCYGFVRGVVTSFLIWVGPLAGLISNASIIAQKSLATKLVSSTEKGRVSAVLSATQSLMPMVGYAMFAPIYHRTVETFPEAQFFFAACLVAIIMVTFLAIHLTNISNEMKKADPEMIKVEEDKKEGVKTKLNFTLSTSDSLKAHNTEMGGNGASSVNNNVLSAEESSVMTGQDSVESARIDATNTSKRKDVIAYGNQLSDADILESEQVIEGTAPSTDDTTEVKHKVYKR